MERLGVQQADLSSLLLDSPPELERWLRDQGIELCADEFLPVSCRSMR